MGFPSRLSPSGPQFFHTWMTLPFARQMIGDDGAGSYPMAVSGSNLSAITIGDTPARLSGVLLSILPDAPATGQLRLNIFAGNPLVNVYQGPLVDLAVLPLNGLFVPFGGLVRLKPGDVLEPSVEVVSILSENVKVAALLSVEYFG